ncbi:zinc-ribbon domain-containing protein, partial [Pelagibacteraceae bacterium]|nr:zinc-ribbon domain-containing protein [Pelagibacteraceae bacterium]
MIITCNNCNKNFDIDSSLIPDKGRLLQCASCNYKWFFKKKVLENTVSPIVKDIYDDSVNVFDQNKSSNNEEINPSDLLKEEIEVDTKEEPKKKIKIDINESTPVKAKPIKQKNFKILNIFIVAI